jgi:putative DNA methylase
MTVKNIAPFSLKDAPALLERVLPAQRLSLEVFKEREGRQGQTLTGLGSYWKGRKPLVLNRACILGALLPATDDLKRDLEVFEMLMGMDDRSFLTRWGRPSAEFVMARVPLPNIYEYFEVDYPEELPAAGPVNAAEYELPDGTRPLVAWREDVADEDRDRLELEAVQHIPYRTLVAEGKRPEHFGPELHGHIWTEVNAHLGTMAFSIPELVEQLGIMRFGRRPRVGDAFAGSGQIPFEAARMGCDAFASDLNPVACLLTWGAMNVVGGTPEAREVMAAEQAAAVASIRAEVERIGMDADGKGAQAKVFLYCLEATCPETGWSVPLLPTLVVSKVLRTVLQLVPDKKNQRYDIRVIREATAAQLDSSIRGTVSNGCVEHIVGGKLHRTNLTTLRGDYTDTSGKTRNRLRSWGKTDFEFRATDIYRERLYAVQWQLTRKVGGKMKVTTEFRTVTDADLERERQIAAIVRKKLPDWQAKGIVPDMAIEYGEETARLFRERGWTHWHHLFNARQLLLAAIVNERTGAAQKFGLTQLLNLSSRLSRFAEGGAPATKGVFDNQALNTLLNYGCRGLVGIEPLLQGDYKNFPLAGSYQLENCTADQVTTECDIWTTDPPYGDAVKYEEILEFFIAWMRKNPPAEFSKWVWDSRRTLAVKGEGDDFRRAMIASYQRLAEKMPDNGLQVVMFTHQDGSIWADMANIIWASGLQVTAAWYVVTETDSALREGSYVKGTILLVLRKRTGTLRTYQSDLAWELEQEVNEQVATLTGLNQQTRNVYRDENLFSDADLQMAGYAAALRVLTKYSVIDGKDMAAEAQRPRVKGQKTLVDELIEFAVGVANQALVPSGIEKPHWDRLQPAERFYLKMLELEAHGGKSLDSYQNFAKAFKVKDLRPLMASEKANAARLKSAIEFGRAEMNDTSELYNTPLRGILYGMMELAKDRDGDEVVAHLAHNIPDFYNQREVVPVLADYLSKKLEVIRPDEASHARVLRDLVRNQRM